MIGCTDVTHEGNIHEANIQLDTLVGSGVSVQIDMLPWQTPSVD